MIIARLGEATLHLLIQIVGRAVHWADPLRSISDAAIIAVAVANRYDYAATFETNEEFGGRFVLVITRRPVTPEVAGSSPAGPASPYFTPVRRSSISTAEITLVPAVTVGVV